MVEKSSCLTHFLLAPLVLKALSCIEFHIFFLQSVWSHCFAKNYADQAPWRAALFLLKTIIVL